MKTKKPTDLHGHEPFRSIGGLPAHLSGLDDPDDHLAVLLDGLEGRCGRGVMVVLDGLELPEDLARYTAHLQ